MTAGASETKTLGAGRRTVHALAQIAFCMLLIQSYREVESVVFEYQGLRWNPPPGDTVTISTLILGILAWLGPPRLAQPSSLMYWMTLITVTTPVMLFSFHAASIPPSAVLPVVISMALAQAMLLFVARDTPSPAYNLQRRDIAPLAALLVLFLVIGISVVVTRPGFSWSFDIIDVYTRRLAARDASPEGALTSYILATLNAAVAPIAVVVAIRERKWILLGLAVLALLSLFAFSGIKSALLTPVFLASFLLIGGHRASVSPLVLFAGAGLFTIIAYVRWVDASDATLSEAFTRRLLVSKGISTEQYFEAFSNSPMWFADSGFMRLFGGVPARAKSFIIGELFGFGAEENANANAWAAMFANIGFAGFAVVSGAVALMMRAFDRLAAAGGASVVRAYAGFVLFIVGETALETSILNGGLLVGIALLVWYVSTARPSQAARV